MAILPVSSANLDSNNRVGFRGDMEVAPLKRVDSDMEGKARTSVGKYATVPVVVLMTLNPSLSAQAAGNNAPEPKQITMEMPYAAPTHSESAEPMYDFASEAAALSAPESAPQTSSTEAPYGWGYLNDYKILYSTNATGNGEKRYLVFEQDPLNENYEISTMYFIKAGSVGPKYIAPPMIQELVYHDLGKNDEYCSVKVVGAIIKNGKDIGREYYEERIDDQTAQILIDILSYKSKWENRAGLKFSVTKDPNIADVKKIYDYE